MFIGVLNLAFMQPCIYAYDIYVNLLSGSFLFVLLNMFKQVESFHIRGKRMWGLRQADKEEMYPV